MSRGLSGAKRAFTEHVILPGCWWMNRSSSLTNGRKGNLGREKNKKKLWGQKSRLRNSMWFHTPFSTVSIPPKCLRTSVYEELIRLLSPSQPFLFSRSLYTINYSSFISLLTWYFPNLRLLWILRIPWEETFIKTFQFLFCWDEKLIES